VARAGCNVHNDSDKPLISRVVKRDTSWRATFDHDGRSIGISGNSFSDAVRITGRYPRCKRWQSKADEGAKGWGTAVRFFDDPA